MERMSASEAIRNFGKLIDNVPRLSPEEQDEAIAFLDKWSDKPPLDKRSEKTLTGDERAEAIWEKYARA